ncbi:MAG: hypothetical protein VKL39_16145, partial [Leptolyngbyaceae bacterium]|nr:hypothetical protein [Leptolyngbyaceae bacterium]
LSTVFLVPSVSLGTPARASGSHSSVEPEAPAAVPCQSQGTRKPETSGGAFANVAFTQVPFAVGRR